MFALASYLADLGGFFTHVLDPSGFPRRWDCGDWSAPHGWLHVVSDLGVWSAYVAIPVVLLYFVMRRQNLPFRFMFVLFGAFILFCGMTHLMEAIIFWWPVYRMAALIKLGTAIVSWATVIALVPITPRALAMKSPEELEETVKLRTAELKQEILDRKRVERELSEQRELLEVTLASIGDAVLATDRQTRITFLNPIAEALTGFSKDEAAGKPLDEVFRILNERTRERVETPCDKVLREGVIVGLANHSVLVAKDGRETPIDDSAAPIRDRDGETVGVVLVFRDASAQRAYVDSREQLAAIVENSQDAMISQDLDGRILSWNAGAENLFGYTAEEAIGRPIDMIIPPERKDEFQESRERLRRGEACRYPDTVRLHKNGTRLEVSTSVSPLRNAEGEVTGASKISHDISQQKRTERALRLLSDAGVVLTELADEASMMAGLARLIVPAVAEWCVINLVRPTGRIEHVACLHADEQRQGLLNELLERYPTDWDAPSAAVEALKSGRPALVGDVPPAMLDAMARDDEHRARIAALDPRSLITVPILIRGKPLGTIQCVRGPSARRFTADDMSVVVELAGRVATALENARLYAETQEAQRQKDDFLAMLAHELRNPLAAIQYANQVVLLTDRPDAAAVETIDRQVKNLSHLIDDLLDVSRITRDKIRLKKDVVDAAMLVRHAVSSVQPQLEARKHTLSLDVAAEPAPLYADATRIEQVLVNLLSNAIKYTPEDGQIQVHCHTQDGQAVFRVEDNGIGIPPDALPRIFDLFTQADRSLDRSQGGLGIGLTVVRKLVEMHAGSVQAASEGLGRGSKFTVRIPLASAQEAQLAEPSSPLRASQPRKILVVDDNLDTAHSLARLLTLAGHDVQMAHNGEAALESARAGGYAIILLDIGLPLLDGYSVAQRIRSDPQFGRPRLIALSGYGQADDRRRSKEAGFDDHLVKPVDFATLLAAIEG